MKYTTKRSKVEEVVIDLEDGCILKVTRNNLDILNVHAICIDNFCITGTDRKLSHYEVSLTLYNGVSYSFETKDKELVNDLTQLTVKWSHLL